MPSGFNAKLIFLVGISAIVASLVSGDGIDGAAQLLGQVAAMETELDKQSPKMSTDAKRTEESPKPLTVAGDQAKPDPRGVVNSQEYLDALIVMLNSHRVPNSRFSNPITRISPLEETMHAAYMQDILLENLGQACQQPAVCPSFSPCGGEYAELEACHVAGFDDHLAACTSGSESTQLLQSMAGDNIPDGESEEDVALPDPTCTWHKPDGSWRESASHLRVFRLRNMFVDEAGFTFNRSASFYRRGCTMNDRTLVFRAGQRQVVEVPRAVGMVYWHGIAFYHSLMELIPTFFHIAPFLREHPDTPILMRCSQWLFYIWLGAPIVGIPPDDLNIVCVEQSTDIFFVKELIQPIFPTCGEPSKELLFEMRRRFYLPPEGLPFFRPDWQPRGTPPLAPAQMRVLPPDWVVVLGRRPGLERNLVGVDEVEAELRRLFGDDRVVPFQGARTIPEAKQVFNRAALFVAAHGAALTNMVFMPSAARVLEIRPAGYPNGCYTVLAHACSLHFRVLWGNGTKETTLTADLGPVLRELGRIQKKLQLPGPAR